VICGFFRQLTASFADSKAGRAAYNAVSASLFNFSAAALA